MKSIAEMVELRKQLVKKGEGILDEAQKAGGKLTKEQETRFNDCTAEIEKLNERIDEELINNEKSQFVAAQRQKVLKILHDNIPSTPTAKKAISKSFRGLFYGNESARLSNNGFNNMDEFLKTIHFGRADERLLNASMVEGIPEFGGFSVPEEYGAFLLDKSMESEIIRPRAAVWSMSYETKKVPAFDSNDRSVNLFGGISGEWLAEGQTGTRKTAKLRLIQLTAKKLACFSQASNELIADGMSFEEMLAGALIKGVGWYMDYAFINGTGEDQPLGILNDTALITVIKEQNQTAATITYNNVVNMFARLAPSCFTKAVWLANPSVIPQLLTMTINIGTAGAQIPVFKEESGRFTLLGKEVIFTEKCPALGAKGDLILADLSQYAIGMRKEIALDRSNVPGWMEDMTDYRVIVRVDGQGTWDKPVKPKNGSILSWVVALEAR